MLHSLQEREVYESVMGNLRCFLFLSVGFTEGIRLWERGKERGRDDKTKGEVGR